MSNNGNEIPCYKTELVARLQADLPEEDVLLRLVRLFEVLSDPTRVRMIGALASGEELCVCDVANVVGISLSATSHQLRKLRDLGVVSHRNAGRMAYYRLSGAFPASLLRRARAHMEAQAV